MSRGLFAYYFGSRDGFHREVVRTAGEALLHATEPRTELGPVDRLRDTLMRLVAFVQEHQGTFFSLVRDTASGDDEVREIVERVLVILSVHTGVGRVVLGDRSAGALIDWRSRASGPKRLGASWSGLQLGCLRAVMFHANADAVGWDCQAITRRDARRSIGSGL